MDEAARRVVLKVKTRLLRASWEILKMERVRGIEPITLHEKEM